MVELLGQMPTWPTSVNDGIRCAWVALSVTALASLSVRCLQSFSLHGKLNSSSSSCPSVSTHTTQADTSPPDHPNDPNKQEQDQNEALAPPPRTLPTANGCCFNLLQISKRWFTMFYLFGLVLNGVVLVVFFGAERSQQPFAQKLLTILHTKELSQERLEAIWTRDDPWQPSQEEPVLLQLNLETWWCLFLLELHLVRRFLECLFVTNFTGSKMHVLALVLGFGHYLLLSVGIVSDPMALMASPEDKEKYRFGWQGALGLYLFAIGSQHQMNCNAILAELKSQRIAQPDEVPEIEKTKVDASNDKAKSSNVTHRRKKRSSAPSKKAPDQGKSLAPTGYGIPQGDWFDHMACPLYTSEILVYAALVCTAKMTNMTLIMATLWVIVNQGISAKRSADWYQKHFPQAKDRFRWKLVPHVW